MADKYIPDDLRDVSTPDTDKNFFRIVITDLELGTLYPLQFRWQYEDKTFSDWSSAKEITTAVEAAPNAPQFRSTDLTNDGASLVVTWSGLDFLGQAYGANLDRIEIFAKGGSFGAEYVNTGSIFKEAGTKVISVSTGATYFVKLRAVTKKGTVSQFSTERSATTVQQLVVDVTAPTNPTGITATAEVDPNDQTGFSLKATFSFTKSSDTSCRGYRIRWTTQTTNPVYEYAFVEHPASGSTVSYTATGLIPNVTYYYQVAAVDELNNTQSYTTAGTFIAQDSVATAEGSLARLKSFISIGGATGDQFKFGTGISESINTSTTITPSLSSGTYHGILLNKTGNKNNYWLTTGQIRVGTDTQFMYFNGTNLYLTGDINAASGRFSGNILMSSSNASLYNISSGHTINTDGTLPAGSTGFVLNASGLQFKVSGSEKITLSATDGTITATNATITGTFRTAASGTRVEMNSGSETNYVSLYSGTTRSYIVGESDGLYLLGAGRSNAHIVLYGPTGTFANGISFGSQAQIVQTDGTDTSATLTSFRLRNITVTTTAPDTSAGAAGTSGGYGSIRLVREA